MSENTKIFADKNINTNYDDNIDLLSPYMDTESTNTDTENTDTNNKNNKDNKGNISDNNNSNYSIEYLDTIKLNDDSEKIMCDTDLVSYYNYKKSYRRGLLHSSIFWLIIICILTAINVLLVIIFGIYK